MSNNSSGNRAQEIENFNKQVDTWNTRVQSQLDGLSFIAESDLDSNSFVNLQKEYPVCEWCQNTIVDC